MRRCLTLTSLVVLATLAACGDPDAPAAPETRGGGRPVVVAVNYPVAYLAERIGGDRIDVQLPVPRGVDPAWWAPDDATLAAYQEADLVLLNGASYAKWVEKASLPLSRLVDTSRAAADRFIEIDEVVTHSHGPEGEHEHKGVAFTVWLDPDIAVAQARAIEKALAGLLPEHAEELAGRREAWEAAWRETTTRMREAALRAPDRRVLFSHPVYQYLERALELDERALHWEPDDVPDAAMWRELDHLRREHPAPVMIWEAAPATATWAALNERGIRIVVFDPAGSRPDEGDFMTVMADNAAALETAWADE